MRSNRSGAAGAGEDAPSPVQLLATTQPSAAVITELARIDPATLSPQDRLWLVQAWEHAQHWTAARTATAIAAITSATPDPTGYEDDDPDRSTAAELSLTLRLSENGARTRLATARALHDQLTPTRHALERGDISYRHVMALTEQLCDRTRAVTTAVQDRVLARAATQTTSQLRQSIRRALATLDPRTEQETHAAARAGRTIERYPEPDGMTTLRAHLPAEDAHTLWLALDTLARRRGATDEHREPIGARRADALTALANQYLLHPDTPTAHGRPVTVHLVIDLPTLLGLAENPAELTGYGPIPATAARALAADGTWQRLVLEPVTGKILDLGTTRYRPTQAIRDHVLARHTTCTFPTCQVLTHRSDLDHLTPYARGGPTSTDNLHPPCRRHHQLKTLHHWKTHPEPDGAITWTDPHGRTFTNPPPNHHPADT